MRGREIECGVLEGEDGWLIASLPGEIAPSNRHGFYTYEAKYLDEDGAAIRVPADKLQEVSDKVRALSIEAFRALGCEGLARIDFFLREDGKLVVNEVNTLPGFTKISMYPKVMEALGIGYSDSVDRLIRHALKRGGLGGHAQALRSSRAEAESERGLGARWPGGSLPARANVFRAL